MVYDPSNKGGFAQSFEIYFPQNGNDTIICNARSRFAQEELHKILQPLNKAEKLMYTDSIKFQSDYFLSNPEPFPRETLRQVKENRNSIFIVTFS